MQNIGDDAPVGNPHGFGRTRRSGCVQDVRQVRAPGVLQGTSFIRGIAAARSLRSVLGDRTGLDVHQGQPELGQLHANLHKDVIDYSLPKSLNGRVKEKSLYSNRKRL